ncbi:Probable pre-mRNA-splicing factor ATP-dependent RNA helicase [Prunus dulcis]|uniref:RNA helicase n=1 Tax=Prunus dulcis TaxID=3755 RepID=A0A4Y1S052_PRUDU|nr:Probable pre-mRNA-splicing factor ATP-dependent RNA helicase [Prunus dulcis]
MRLNFQKRILKYMTDGMLLVDKAHKRTLSTDVLLGLLYNAYNYQHDLDDNAIPQIQRMKLANVVLILKSLDIHDLLHFDFMDPPPTKSLIKDVYILFALVALNKFGEQIRVVDGRQSFLLIQSSLRWLLLLKTISARMRLLPLLLCFMLVIQISIVQRKNTFTVTMRN